MTNLHTTTDVSRFIGALELGNHIGLTDDGSLEAVSTRIAAGPTHGGCPVTNPVMCHHIDDDALETAGTNAALNPAPTQSFMVPGCRHIDDGALEAAGTAAAFGPQTNNPAIVYCRHIDDVELETVGKAVSAGPTSHLSPITHRCI